MGDGMIEDYICNVVYQGKFNIKSKKICGFEALIRFKSKMGEILDTEQMINKTDCVEDKRGITNYVIDAVAKDLETIRMLNIENLLISVNISYEELEDTQFEEWICSVASKYKSLNTYIEFEITERDKIRSMDNLNKKIGIMKKLGFKICLDDIGSGNNTIELIHKLDIDSIKIDRKITNSILNIDLVECIIKIVKTKGIEVIAEGVENIRIYNLLKNMRCDVAQGYFIHKPETIQDIIENKVIDKWK